MRYCFLFTIISLLSFINTGCATGHDYLVKQKTYVPAAAPAQDQTRVFVFRGTNLAASAGRIIIIDNDTIVGALDTGNFTSFETSKNKNVIVVTFPTPVGARSYAYFDGRQGKDVYLYFNIVMGGYWYLHEIDKKEAQKLMEKYKYMELTGPINRKWNINYLDFYERLQKQKGN